MKEPPPGMPDRWCAESSPAYFRSFYGADWKAEKTLTLPDARLVHADLDALRRDLGSAVPRQELGRPGLPWLVEQTAVLSRVQVAHRATQSTVRRTGPEKRVYRAPRYTRAALIPVRLPSGSSVLFDVKGCGTRPGYRPEPGGAHGLLSLSDALHELVFARLVRAALLHAEHPARPVSHYALIDLGVDVLDEHGRPVEPAVLLVRQARPRPEFQWGERSPGEAVAAELLHIELALRRYGITASSTGALRFRLSSRGGRLQATENGTRLAVPPGRLARIARHVSYSGEDLLIDGVNVQIATGPPGAGRALIDFGSYRLSDSFTRPLFAAADRDWRSLRGPFLGPHDPRYPQPSAVHGLAGRFAGLYRERMHSLMTGFGRETGARTRFQRRLTAFLHEVDHAVGRPARVTGCEIPRFGPTSGP